MPKQPESASALAKGDSSTLEMLRITAILGPHQMVEAMKRLFPFTTDIPGLNPAHLTEIQERNFSAIANASTNIQKMLSDNVTEEYRMLQECVRETMQQISSVGAPTGTAAKQMEMVARLFEKISKDTIELMERNRVQLSAITKDMTARYVATLNEIKQMSQESST